MQYSAIIVKLWEDSNPRGLHFTLGQFFFLMTHWQSGGKIRPFYSAVVHSGPATCTIQFKHLSFLERPIQRCKTKPEVPCSSSCPCWMQAPPVDGEKGHIPVTRIWLPSIASPEWFSEYTQREGSLHHRDSLPLRILPLRALPRTPLFFALAFAEAVKTRVFFSIRICHHSLL